MTTGMTRRLYLTTVLVRDYDEAIAFYAGVLGFAVRVDTPLSAVKRWVVLAPPGGGQGCILLARADTPEQIARIGDQTGGRVFLFLDTDDFERDYRNIARAASFLRKCRDRSHTARSRCSSICTAIAGI